MSADANAKVNDPVNHPAHYTSSAMETWEAIEGLGLGFHAGNVVKYLSRYKLKGGIQDLHKARAYLNRLIEVEEREEAKKKSPLNEVQPIKDWKIERNAAFEAGRQTGKNMFAFVEIARQISKGIQEGINEPVAIQSKRRGPMVKATNKGDGKRQRKGSINRRK